MKHLRPLFTFLAILLAVSVSAQETVDNTPSFEVIGRLDGGASFTGEGVSFDLGNTGLYTQLSGNIGPHLSYLLVNHWLSPSPKELYDATLRSDSTNWVDYAYLNYNTGGWDFQLGKGFIPFGTFEEMNDDVTVHPSISSQFWWLACLYQWGLQASYTFPSESTSLMVGVSASPFDEKPFQQGLLTYSLSWTGNYGPYASRWSASVFEMPGKRYVSTLALGNQLTFGHLALSFDFVNSAALDVAGFFRQEMTLVGGLGFQLSESVDLLAKCGWERSGGPEPLFLTDVFDASAPYTFAGAAVHYFPLKDKRNLRLHGVVSWNSFLQGVAASVGVLYNLDVAGLL